MNIGATRYIKGRERKGTGEGKGREEERNWKGRKGEREGKGGEGARIGPANGRPGSANVTAGYPEMSWGLPQNKQIASHKKTSAVNSKL